MQDKIEALLKNPWTIPAVIGALSFGGGLGAGYFLAKRKYERFEIHELPEQLGMSFDIEDVESWTEKPSDTKPNEPELTRPPKVVLTPEVAVSKDILKVNDLSELRPSMLEPTEEVVEEPELPDEDEPEITVETTDEIDWDWEEEVGSRADAQIYVLHREEFYADEMNYTQTTLSYYEGDDIMADEDDKPVYNHSNTVGPLKFGHGSGDPNVFYVRNEKNRAEYEILKLEDALYSVEILGLEIENNERVADLKHSKLLKFRTD